MGLITFRTVKDHNMVNTACRPPCVANVAEDLPGVIPSIFVPENSAGSSAQNPIFITSAGDVETDVAWTATATQVTSATANVWTELFPALATREGGFIQSKAASGSIYIMPFDTGLPSNGTHPGEIEIPPRPSFYGFDVDPHRRWVVRGDAVSLAFSAAIW